MADMRAGIRMPSLAPGATAENTPIERAHVLASLRRRGLDGKELAQMLELVPPAEEPAPRAVCSHGHDQDQYGRMSSGRAYCAACRSERRRLAGVWAESTGSMRRVRHLLLNGWSGLELSRMVGYSSANLSRLAVGSTPRITADVAHRIQEVFEVHRSEIPRATSGYYAGRGWVHVEAYQDVDDPGCVPSVHLLTGAAS